MIKDAIQVILSLINSYRELHSFEVSHDGQIKITYNSSSDGNLTKFFEDANTMNEWLSGNLTPVSI